MNDSGTSTRAPKPSALHAPRIIKGLQADGNPWLNSTEIGTRYVSDLSKASRYNVIHRMAHADVGMLEKKQSAPGAKFDYQYRLSEKYLNWTQEADAANKTVSRTYIRWTTEERLAVAELTYSLRKSGDASGMAYALEKAQDMLIKEGRLSASKRRKMTFSRIRTEFSGLMEQIAKKKQEPEPTVAQHATVSVEPPKPEPTPPIPEPVQKPVEAPSPPQATHAPRAADIATGALLGTLIGRFEHSLTKILANAVEHGITRAFRDIMSTEKGEKIYEALTKKQVVPPVQKHNPVASTPDRERLKKVLVLAPEPTWIGPISSEFKNALDLRFWMPGQAHNLLKTLVKNVDTTVIMTDRVRHSDSELVTDAHVPYVPLSGGLSSLKEKLTEIFAE